MRRKSIQCCYPVNIDFPYGHICIVFLMGIYVLCSLWAYMYCVPCGHICIVFLMGIYVLCSLWAYMYCVPYGHICIVFLVGIYVLYTFNCIGMTINILELNWIELKLFENVADEMAAILFSGRWVNIGEPVVCPRRFPTHHFLSL